MKQRLLALLLVLILASTIVVSAFATENEQPIFGAATETTETAAVESEEEAVAETSAETVEETEAEAGGDTASDPVDALLKEIFGTGKKEDSSDVIPFEELAERVKKNSPAYNAVRSNVMAIEDAKDTVSELEKGLPRIEASLQEIDSMLSPIERAIADIDLADPDGTNDSLQAEKAYLLAQKTSLLGTKATVMEQKMQIQSGISGLNALAGQNPEQARANGYQVIMGCESMYIALVGLEIQEAALVRQLSALDRTIAELKIRQDGGQISKLQLLEAETGRASLVSGLTTLRMNMTNLQMQMESMLGEKITGTIEVGALPKVTAEQLDAIDPAKDLDMVLRGSPAVQAASDQEDNLYASGMNSFGGDLWGNMADAAHYAVQNAKLTAETNYRALYAELMDCRQALTAAQSALEVEELSFRAQELKYDRGSISRNALLTAADELQTAREAVLTAENNLFSVYNEYNWAVEHGVFM